MTECRVALGRAAVAKWELFALTDDRPDDVQDDICAEVGNHRRDESESPEEPAEDDAGHSVADHYSNDHQR